MSDLRPPPYAHTDPEHPGSGCWGCTPMSHEVEWLRARVVALEGALRHALMKGTGQPGSHTATCECLACRALSPAAEET